MFILWWESDASELPAQGKDSLLFLSVHVFEEGRDKGALFNELLSARGLLEVVVDLLQLVVAACKNYHEEGHYARETLQTTVPR